MKNTFTFMFSFLMIFQIHSQEVWKITTLEWPPFSCSNCPEGGAGVKVLRDILKEQGYTVKFEFLPWTRAIETAKQNDYIGYYPAWPNDVIEGFVKSEVVFRSPIGFLENTKKPLGNWNKLSDLKGKTIGIVQDYGYTDEFLALVKSKAITGDVVTSPDTNIKKLIGNRIQGTIIDRNVATYYISTDFKKHASSLRMQDKNIANMDLVLAVQKSKLAKVNAAIKKGAASGRAQKMVDDYLKKHYK